MTKADYDAAVDVYLIAMGGSTISGRRTVAHTKAVGGFAGDPHCGGFGTDCVYDVVPDIHHADEFAATLGLMVLREHHANGDHLQPRDWQNDTMTA